MDREIRSNAAFRAPLIATHAAARSGPKSGNEKLKKRDFR